MMYGGWLGWLTCLLRGGHVWYGTSMEYVMNTPAFRYGRVHYVCIRCGTFHDTTPRDAREWDPALRVQDQYKELP